MKDYRVPQLGATSPNSELRLRPALRYAIRYRGQIFPIQGSQATLGRNLDCDIVLSGPLVSRLHARLIIDSDGVQVEDLLSRNGVAVDGVLIDRPQRIEPGARIRLGDEALELVGERIDRGPRVPTLNLPPPGSGSAGFVSAGLSSSLPPPTSWHPSSGPPNGDYASSPGGTKESDRPSGRMLTRESERPSGQSRLPDSQRTLPLEEYDELTHRADLFDLLGSAVERAFAVNNGEEVVRLIGRHLERIVDQARTERHPNDELYGRAALYAVRLAVSTGRATWFDYVIRLYSTLLVPLPLPIVDQLSAHIRRVPGINRQTLRDYVARLRHIAGRMTAEQRFRLQRVESLERLVSL